MLRSILFCCSALALSGCGMVAQMGAIGAFQAANQGSVSVKFAPTNDAFPNGRKVAIWPDNEAEVLLAERLSSSGLFTVTPPNRVKKILAAEGTDTSLSGLTSGEQQSAFESVCRRTNDDMVIANVVQKTDSSGNAFSFFGANVAYGANLFAFSCARRQVAWKVGMQLSMYAGSTTPSKMEIMQAAGNAMADRIIQAAGGTQTSSAR